MYRVVGLEVEPFSLAEDEDRFLSPETQVGNKREPCILKLDEPIRFTYAIHTVDDPKLAWANRMDHYTKIT